MLINFFSDKLFVWLIYLNRKIQPNETGIDADSQWIGYV